MSGRVRAGLQHARAEEAEYLRAHGWQIRGLGLSRVYGLGGKTWPMRTAALAHQRRLCAQGCEVCALSPSAAAPRG